MTHRIDLIHQTSTGHRIPGHEGGRGKCAHLHGHTYEFAVQLASETLDGNGFVVDFGRVKAILNEWDHRLVLHDGDPIRLAFYDTLIGETEAKWHPDNERQYGVVRVPFVPTAENMARHLAQRFTSEFDNVFFAHVTVRESDKTGATFGCTKEEARRDLRAATVEGA